MLTGLLLGNAEAHETALNYFVGQNHWQQESAVVHRCEDVTQQLTGSDLDEPFPRDDFAATLYSAHNRTHHHSESPSFPIVRLNI